MEVHLLLSKRLYQETQVAHEQVENLPFVIALRNEKLTQKEYTQHLADLRVVYESLEKGMLENINLPTIKALYDENLCRTNALEQDLRSFSALDLKPTMAAKDYVNHLNELSKSHPNLLIAHAYVRYLGDLSGGRMIKTTIEKLFPGEHTAFYNFDDLLGPNAMGAKFVEYKNKWKDQLDVQEFTDNDKLAMVEEAKKAFEFTGRMFNSVVQP